MANKVVDYSSADLFVFVPFAVVKIFTVYVSRLFFLERKVKVMNIMRISRYIVIFAAFLSD
jgi:hypothetical protein